MPKLLPQAKPGIDLRSLYFDTPMGPVGTPGGISAAPAQTVTDKMHEAIAGAIRDRVGKRMGEKFATAMEFTPAGAITSAVDAGAQLRKKADRSAVANAMLQVAGSVPEAGPVAKAMFLGVLAKKADRAALHDARELEYAGVNPSRIFEATGWFRGKDNRWRFEIDDSPLRFGPHLDQTEKLKTVMSHPELLENYPELKDYTITLDAPHEGGTFFPGFDSLMVQQSVLRPRRVDRSVAAHELQHAIQEIEGHASGGPYYDPEYHRLAGEVEARQVQQRLLMDADTRKGFFPPWHQDVPPHQQVVRIQTKRVKKPGE